jgi:CDP-2,3-bis-(O-geranylgeranyl)-sn-glycerol synthase
MYVANSIPVILGGGMRLDLDKNFFDGKPIFGEGKTIRGFLAGVLGGAVVAGIIAFVYPLNWFPVSSFQFWGGCAMALGTMCGDAAGSFFKRRMGMKSGRPFFPDTMIFVAFALAFAIPFVLSSFYTLENLAFIFGLTIILHPSTNYIANKLGLKKVPW